MTRGSVNLWEIGDLRGVYHVDMFCSGVSFICAYYVLDTETSQSLTTIHRHFHTPTSLCPRHFDSHSHFSLPFLVLETQKLEPSRTNKTTSFQRNNSLANICFFVKSELSLTTYLFLVFYKSTSLQSRSFLKKYGDFSVEVEISE